MHGIVNLGLVESAIHRPYNGYYRRIERKAAALVESVAGNHGFADGNKRTTLILVHTLLTKSGYRLVPARHGESSESAAEEMILSLKLAPLLTGFRGSRRLDIPALAQLLALLSRIATDHRDRIAEMEFNPVIVHADGSGLTIADALITLKD